MTGAPSASILAPGNAPEQGLLSVHRNASINLLEERGRKSRKERQLDRLDGEIMGVSALGREW